MRALVFDAPGGEEVLRVGEAPAPSVGANDVRIRVRAAGVNRADLLQRRGLYPPPPGASPILGLECAGEVLEVGSAVRRFTPGQRVMALLAGGGCAAEAVAHEGSVLPVPAGWSDVEAGGFMEAAVTAFLNIFLLGEPPEGGTVLVHGGSGGVGTAAIAMCKRAALRVIVTAGSPERCARCRELGAERAVDYNREDFVAAARELGGAHVVLDCIGAPYFERNLAALAPGGALVLIGLMGGATGEVSLAPLLGKRARVIGSTLRSRTTEDKAAIIAALSERFRDSLAELRPRIDRVLPLERAADAHRAIAGAHFGKIVLTP